MAEITVFDLCSLYIEHDEEVVIWNVQKEKEVFRGTFSEAMYIANSQIILWVVLELKMELYASILTDKRFWRYVR